MAIRTESQLSRERRELEQGWTDARGARYLARFLQPLDEAAAALRNSMVKFEIDVSDARRDGD
jgi:hypothetical protein